VRMEAGTERFLDASLGDQSQEPAAQCGDLLVRDRLGHWTYQFAVVVDDIRHAVDLVIRGQDLLGSTGRQLRLARLLGRERAPVFLHHRLISKPDGAKLSKASGDTGIRDLRRAGVGAPAVLGRAAWLTGLLPRPRELCVGELAGLFGER
jgi:glutamyl-Q tRNA(Asp) synthetase